MRGSFTHDCVPHHSRSDEGTAGAICSGSPLAASSSDLIRPSIVKPDMFWFVPSTRVRGA